MPEPISRAILPSPGHSGGPYKNYHIWGSWEQPNYCLSPHWFSWNGCDSVEGQRPAAMPCAVLWHRGKKRAIIIMTVKIIQPLCWDIKPKPYASICSCLAPSPSPGFSFPATSSSIIPLLFAFRTQQHLRFKPNRKLPGYLKATPYYWSESPGYFIY